MSFLILTHIRLYQYAFDDAYIHFRVARHLFENGTPFYNVNNMLKVSTSSGWIVFITALYWIATRINLQNSFPLFVSLTNALILLFGLFVYSKIVEILLKKEFSISQKLLFQIIYIAILLPSSIGLMETPLALLIAGLGIYFLLLGRPLGFVLLGFATYIRLELFILLALICILVYFQKQFRFYQIIGYTIFGFFPLVCFDLNFYHTIVPHSITAKSIIYSSSLLSSFLRTSSISLPGISNINIHIWVAKTSIFIITIIMMSWVAYRERANQKDFWPALFCFTSLCIIGFYSLGQALVFDWYTPLHMLPILVTCFIYSFLIEKPRNIIIKIPLFILFSFSLISLGTTFYASFYKPSTFSLFESGSRVKMYLMVGKIINDEYPNATLLTSEIGGLGYSFRGKIFDAAGLASSTALAYHPMKIPEQRPRGDIGAIPPEYVMSVSPDIIVSYDIFAQALLNDEITSQYNVIAIPAYLPEDAKYSESKTIWGSKYLRVYIHKSLPVSEKVCALALISKEIPAKLTTESCNSPR
jgi:hypothetical protein